MIHKFTERSFLDGYEFYLFKEELKQPRKASGIIAHCNREKISYKQYRQMREEEHPYFTSEKSEIRTLDDYVMDENKKAPNY